ncbi:hypothetical protein BC827DRAFT_1155387 [Russula dissimulans]|nr:hypothetical protein BC827DRAFT_1155387 [Russula dissimulans]
MSQTHQPSLLVDGYISQCVGLQQTEAFFRSLLKDNSSYAPYYPERESGYFIATSVPQHIQVQSPNPGSWIIDRGLMSYGTVVPQGLWVPHTYTDRRQHVAEAELQMPIFFEDTNRRLGITLEDAASGRCHGLLNAQCFALLGNKSTTHIRILWPGYVEFRRQVQIRDETSERNPINIFRFAYHIGRSVDAFLRTRQPDAGHSDPRWRIGEGGISPRDIIIIGAINVSSASWQPILQLNRFIF